MVLKQPTCVSPGGFEYTCTTCGDHRLDTLLEQIPEGMYPALFETVTQYRWSDIETRTSYDTSMEGYTQKSWAWEKSGSGAVEYVSSWSSGIKTSNYYYTKYDNKTSKVTASETATTKRVIDLDAVSGYVYHHWCYSGSYYSLQSTSGSYTTCHVFYSTTAPSSLSNYDASDGSLPSRSGRTVQVVLRRIPGSHGSRTGGSGDPPLRCSSNVRSLSVGERQFFFPTGSSLQRVEPKISRPPMSWGRVIPSSSQITLTSTATRGSM